MAGSHCQAFCFPEFKCRDVAREGVQQILNHPCKNSGKAMRFMQWTAGGRRPMSSPERGCAIGIQQRSRSDASKSHRGFGSCYCFDGSRHDRCLCLRQKPWSTEFQPLYEGHNKTGKLLWLAGFLFLMADKNSAARSFPVRFFIAVLGLPTFVCFERALAAV